jgi:hypothetical protein
MAGETVLTEYAFASVVSRTGHEPIATTAVVDGLTIDGFLPDRPLVASLPWRLW